MHQYIFKYDFEKVHVKSILEHKEKDVCRNP